MPGNCHGAKADVHRHHWCHPQRRKGVQRNTERIVGAACTTLYVAGTKLYVAGQVDVLENLHRIHRHPSDEWRRWNTQKVKNMGQLRVTQVGKCILVVQVNLCYFSCLAAINACMCFLLWTLVVIILVIALINVKNIWLCHINPIEVASTSNRVCPKVLHHQVIFVSQMW